jgi:hypothetical protein
MPIGRNRHKRILRAAALRDSGSSRRIVSARREGFGVCHSRPIASSVEVTSYGQRPNSFRSRIRRRVGDTEPQLSLESVGEDVANPAFDQAKNQASVVGSEVISFVKGVTPDARNAIANSALLAQLAANGSAPSGTDIYRWYDRYFEVLRNIGWTIQKREFVTYQASGTGFEAQEAILDVAAALFGPGATSGVMLKATIDALRSLRDADSKSPVITIFDQQSQHAQAARFQVSLVQDQPDKNFAVALLAFGLEANSTITQVLFFKVRKGDATLKHMSGRVAITSEIMAHVASQIEAKVAAYQSNFIRTLDLTDPRVGKLY